MLLGAKPRRGFAGSLDIFLYAIGLQADDRNERIHDPSGFVHRVR